MRGSPPERLSGTTVARIVVVVVVVVVQPRPCYLCKGSHFRALRALLVEFSFWPIDFY